MRKVRFIVCNNGYGHLRRVLKVVAAMLERGTELNIEIYCDRMKLEALSDVKGLIGQPLWNNVIFDHASMVGIPEYNATAQYDDFVDWMENIKNPDLDELVVLDNEAIMLGKFPDAVLMGSFLWSDVITAMDWKGLRNYAEKEREYLLKYRPHMLGIGDMAMDNVRNLTSFVALPWMVNRTNPETMDTTERGAVLLTMGGSVHGNGLFDSGLLADLKSLGVSVFVDSNLYKKFKGVFPLFKFDAASFRKVKLVIGRPGIGILTECAQYSIPIACFYESGNPEMAHNASCVEQMKTGVDLVKVIPELRLSRIKDMLTIDTGAWMRANWRLRAVDGAQVAADWLISRMANSSVNQRMYQLKK